MKQIKRIKGEIIESYTLDRLVQRDPYTFVSVVAKIDGKDHVGHGFSKRNPIDEPDPELGQIIAVGRAVHDIALQIYQQRNGNDGKFDLVPELMCKCYISGSDFGRI